MAILRWIGQSGLRITVLIALATFALHLYGELASFGGGEPSFLQRLERTALDAKFTHRGATPPREWRVAIAAIDERSIEQVGQFPWPRDVHARVIDRLTALGAGVIAFDVTFSQPTAAAGAEVVDAVRTTLAASGLYEAKDRLERAIPGAPPATARAMSTATAAIDRARLAISGAVVGPSPDEALARAIRESGRVVLGVVSYSTEEALALEAAPLAEALRRVRSATISEYVHLVDGLAEIAPDSRHHFENAIYHRFAGVQAPIPLLAEAATFMGTINAFPDGDGVIRHVPLVSGISGVPIVLPTFALAAVAALKAPMPIEIVADRGDDFPYGIRVDDLFIETGFHAATTIDWYGTRESSGLPFISIADILEGRVAAEAVADKIVFVAATALGTYDQRVTPMSRAVPGVYVHATVAQNLLDGRNLIRPLYVVALELLIMLGIGLFGGLVLTRLSAPLQLLTGTGLAVAWVLLDRYVFFVNGVIVQSVLPALQIFATMLGVTSWRFVMEEKERRKIRNAFQRYLAPAVMEQVLAHPEEYLRLGGRRYEATVLFSDIRGFTTLAEAMSPEALGRLLNLYMTPMTNLVFQTGGTLDKYIGDAVMAFWGAPLQQDDHAARACRTALRMIRKVEDLNQAFAAEGLPQIAIGIGLSSGPMTIGNMGSDDFFSYTALGDRVNLGARLEGQTKSYGVDILISEACFDLVRSSMACRELGGIRVKGKLEPVKIYELVGEHPLPPEQQAFVDAFHGALARYYARDFEGALREFERASALRTNGDKSAREYAEECRQYLVEQPPAEWDGVRVATSK